MVFLQSVILNLNTDARLSGLLRASVLTISSLPFELSNVSAVRALKQKRFAIQFTCEGFLLTVA
jgi:hypothetical protein